MTTLIERVGQFISPEWDFEYACCREAILFTNVLYGMLFVVNSVIFILYFYVFLRNKTLHANFRVILLIFAANDMALVYHRVADFWLTGTIDRENGFTYFVKMNCWATLILSLCNVIGERTFAIYSYKWYHDAHWRFPAPMIIIYAIQESFTCLLIGKRIVSKKLIIDCLGAVIAFTTVFLIGIYRISRRRHRQMIASRFQWSDDNLSRRHRTMEILRENHLLEIFLPYLLISTILQFAEALILSHFVLPIDHRYYLIIHCGFYLTIAIRVFFDLVIPIIAHPVIKAETAKIILSLTNRIQHRRKVSANMTPTPRPLSAVHSTDGQRLSFSPEQEKEMYFAGYAQLWGAH